MSLRNDVLHSLKWLAAGKFLGQLIAWTITLVVIRILDPSDYGLMAIAEVFIGFAALFREMGLYSAMIQKRDLTERQIEQSFGLLIIINSVIYLFLFLAAPLFSLFFGDPRLTPIVQLLGIQFPLASFGVVQGAMLSRSMKFKRVSGVNFVVTLSSAFTTLALALSGAGVWALVYGSLVGAVVLPIGLIIAARHWCRPRFTRDGMAEMMRFGGYITTSRILWYVYSRADVFIIGKLLGQSVLGYYSVALQLAALPMQKITGMLNDVGLAAYSSIQQDMDAVRSHFRKVVRVLSFVAFPMFWGISCVAPDLVMVVLGERWSSAIVPLQLLSLVMPIRMVVHGSGGPITAIGKPHIETINVLIALLIMTPSFLVGTYYLGLVGACMAWIIGYPLVTVIRLQISLPLLGLTNRDYFGSMRGPATGGAIMYLTVILVRDALSASHSPPWLTLLILVGIGASTYATFMWYVRRTDCREILGLAGR